MTVLPSRSGWMLGGAVVVACLSFAIGARALTSIAAQRSETPSDTLPERGIRERTQPGMWDRGPVRGFKTVLDRETARAQSVADRATRRAYNGAPPVMPHSAIFGQGTKECLDCHAEGMKIGNRTAHPMSHPPLLNCVQCHVESQNRMFDPGEAPASTFEGLASGGYGPRWTPVAPPQIPHDINMRTHCLSCHGEFGYPGIRTEHPERSNCVQCHITAERTR